MPTLKPEIAQAGTNRPAQTIRKGLALPFRANESGGVALVSGQDNDNKIITIALLDGENDNAFQQDLAGSQNIFDIGDTVTRELIIERVSRVFASLERQNRYKLVEESIVFTQEGGDAIMFLNYINLEAQEQREYGAKL